MAFYSLMFLAFAEHFIISTGESFLIIMFCCVGACVYCRCLYLCTCARMNTCQRLSRCCIAVVRSPPVLMRAWRFAFLSLKPIELSCSSSSLNSLSVWWTWHNMTWELFKVLLIKIMCERIQNEIIISDLIVNPFKQMRKKLINLPRFSDFVYPDTQFCFWGIWVWVSLQVQKLLDMNQKKVQAKINVLGRKRRGGGIKKSFLWIIELKEMAKPLLQGDKKGALQ